MLQTPKESPFAVVFAHCKATLALLEKPVCMFRWARHLTMLGCVQAGTTTFSLRVEGALPAAATLQLWVLSWGCPV